jgi:hypothetical protein
MPLTALLERFDTGDGQKTEAATPSDDWRAGHAAGLAEGATIAATKHAVLRDDLVQSVADFGFAFAEARAHMLASLTPLLTAVCDLVLPAATQSILVARVMSLLGDAAAHDLNRPLHLCVAEGDLAAIRTALAGQHLPHLRLSADPNLAAGQVCLMQGGQETVLNVPALISAIGAALQVPVEETRLRSEHG